MAKWVLHFLLLTTLTACSGLILEVPQESGSIEKEIEKNIPKEEVEIKQSEEKPKETTIRIEITEKKEDKESDSKPKETEKRGPSHTESEDEEKGQKKEEQITVMTPYEKEVVELINQERKRYGYSPLLMDQKATLVARKKSADMRDKGYFSHQSPTYGSPFEMLKKEHIRFTMAGENIAAGQRSPRRVVQDWMNSEGHRKNILNPAFTHIGVGYEKGGFYGTYWTQLFIRK